jgi:hypothetical protein
MHRSFVAQGKSQCGRASLPLHDQARSGTTDVDFLGFTTAKAQPSFAIRHDCSAWSVERRTLKVGAFRGDGFLNFNPNLA